MQDYSPLVEVPDSCSWNSLAWSGNPPRQRGKCRNPLFTGMLNFLKQPAIVPTALAQRFGERRFESLQSQVALARINDRVHLQFAGADHFDVDLVG